MPYINLRVREVTSSRDLMAFIKLPWRIYKGDPYWVPPLISERKEFLDPRKNPSFQHMEVTYFLVEGVHKPEYSTPVPLAPGTLMPAPIIEEGPVGRIAAFINHLYNEVHDEQVGFFGFFESVNDPDVAHLLLETACNWVAERGMHTIIGPMNFSTNDECGMLIDGFNSPPTILMPYNPPYYPELVESYGFEKAMDLLAYMIDNSAYRSIDDLPPKLIRVVNAVRKRHPEVRVRPANIADFANELRRLKAVYNRAWEKNWGFVPLTDEEIDHMAKAMRPLVDPDLVYFAEVRKNGEWEPIAVSITLPDYYQVLKHLNGRLFPFGWLKFLWYRRKIDTARVFALGVVHEWHGRGIDALLYYETAKVLFAKGYRRAEMSWILENNVMMNRSVQFFGGIPYKRYRIYQKSLDNGGGHAVSSEVVHSI